MQFFLPDNKSKSLYDNLNALSIEYENKSIFSAENIKHLSSILKEHIDITDKHINTLKEEGYLEFSNLPVDRIICSPPSNASRPYNKGYISEMLILGITQACGVSPFAYSQEKKGALVHEITPIKNNLNSISSEGSIDFAFHTDGAYLSRNIRPHTLSLICLEDTKSTGTNLVKLSDVVKKLDQSTKEILINKNFIHTAPETFKVHHKQVRSSILDFVDGEYEIKAALHNTKPIDNHSKLALEKLKLEISNNMFTKSWKKGDLIIFNNLKCMHGRGEIKGSRWLQRCYGSYTFSPATVCNLN